MAGKNVALREEVVDLLDREKHEGESYSDVILRLAKGRSLTSVVEALERRGFVEDDSLTRRVQEIRRAQRVEPRRRPRL